VRKSSSSSRAFAQRASVSSSVAAAAKHVEPRTVHVPDGPQRVVVSRAVQHDARRAEIKMPPCAVALPHARTPPESKPRCRFRQRQNAHLGARVTRAWLASVARVGFRDDFEGRDLDRAVWIPHYLPQWSSRAESAAMYEVAGSELRLSIPPGQGLWCPETHDEPLRVSGIQSGVFSGPVGSTVGQQPFRDGLVVREEQPAQWGWTPHYGVLEVRARMELSTRSMASVWLVGVEDEPRRSGEICIFEIFGDAIDSAGPAVGAGIHPFRDPALSEDFATTRLPIDVSDFHTYAADWRPGCVEFSVDGEHLRTVDQAPDYPLQMMVGVFDFPEKPGGDHVPRLVVDYVAESAGDAARSHKR
jgi:Glycosyl hydrolases family 16